MMKNKKDCCIITADKLKKWCGEKNTHRMVTHSVVEVCLFYMVEYDKINMY